MAESNFKVRSPQMTTVVVTAGADQEAGDVVRIDAAGPYGVVVGGPKGEAEIANGDEMVVAVKVEKLVGVTYNGADGVFGVGDPVYWDAADAKFSNAAAAGANSLVGYAREAALSADTEVLIEFDGTLQMVVEHAAP